MIQIDRATPAPLETRLDKGHTLKIKIPASSLTREITRAYREAKEQESETKHSSPPDFVVRRVNLVGLDRSESAFIYHQQRMAPRGTPIGDAGVELTIPEVPPGRMALRLDGGYHFGPEAHVDGTEAYWTELMGFPIAYTEFIMPDKNSKITMPFHSTDLEISLDAAVTEKNKDALQMVAILLERKSPYCLGLWGDPREMLGGHVDQAAFTADMHRIPFYSTMSGFGGALGFSEPDGNKSTFRFLPPGEYRVSVYENAMELERANAIPCYQSEITVAEANSKTVLTVPAERCLVPADR